MEHRAIYAPRQNGSRDERQPVHSMLLVNAECRMPNAECRPTPTAAGAARSYEGAKTRNSNSLLRELRVFVPSRGRRPPSARFPGADLEARPYPQLDLP